MSKFVKKCFCSTALFLAVTILCVGCTKGAVTSDVGSVPVNASKDVEHQSKEEPTAEESAVYEDAPPEQSSPTEPAPPAPRVIVINAYSPYQAQSYAAGSVINVIIAARPDSNKVTASFNGQTINLIKQQYEGTPEFVNFTGSFTLPSGNEENLKLGKIKYYAEWNGHSETFYSPSITCPRDPKCDRITVVEVVAESAETFNGNTVDDNSDPRLSPLPKGTVDYRVGGIIYDSKSKKSYYKLRCGRRVYVDKPNPPSGQYAVTVAYQGELPDTNKIKLNNSRTSGGYTYISFDTEWKAPFAVTVEPQQYNNPSARDFTVNSFTGQYVDIKFYYATDIGSATLADNPLFNRAEVVAQEGGTVLRLHLKKTGGFYGWNAYYNSQGQLEFKFLNPKRATATSNKYGASLAGITVMLDAGHGGRDPGATGAGNVYEAERNLNLSYKIKAELESIGATVILTRADNADVTAEARCSIMRTKAPDLCVSIHHNSSTRASANGADFYCFNAFSSNATTALFARTNSSGIYNKVSKGWHYFYMGRVTSCPLVLIENGYISNPNDFAKICDEAVNSKKAYYITQGIADYFLSIN